jgi:hypothetical protein
MKMVDFWAVPLYSLVDAEDVSGKLQLPSWNELPDDGVSKLLWNVSQYQQSTPCNIADDSYLTLKLFFRTSYTC